MTLQINDFPNEVLCKVLNCLNTKEKFLARRVCKRWMNQIDQNVIFHIVMNDDNYNVIRLNFGKSRFVRSIWIFDYSHEDIPVQSLALLQTLTVRGDINKLALNELLTKAKNLDHLQLYVDHGRESAIIKEMPTKTNNFPALLSIKNLHIGYDSRSSWLEAWSKRVWNEILYAEMPNVHRLVVDLYPNIPQLRGFDYFRLASGMPKLRDFTYRVWNGQWSNWPMSFMVNGDVQALTPKIYMGLATLNLIQLTASIAQKDETVWKIILNRQHQLQKLSLRNEHNSLEGFPLSMILPVLHNSRNSLRSISLQIDTKKSGDIDMEIFSSLPFLQKLFIQAWPIPPPGKRFALSNVQNCSNIVSETLERLSVRGFHFSEEDVINLIKNISNEELDKVQISAGYASFWKSFETEIWMNEMGIVRYYGHSKSLNANKVYVGATLEKYHDEKFLGLLKSGFSRKVKDVVVESKSLQLTSRYIYNFK